MPTLAAKFCALVVLASLGACAGESAHDAHLQAGASPNVLLIVADDLGWGDLGCFMSPVAITPHLDRLAGEGLRFSQFFVASPMCSPSRASLLTGRTPARHGLEQALISDDPSSGLDPDEVLLSDLLAARGYATGLVGKWHLGTGPEHHPLERGFESFFGMLAGSSGYYTHTYRGTPDLWRDRAPVTSDEYSTDLFSDEAIAFIEDRRDAAWFLLLSYNAPHLADDRRSLPAPEVWREAYRDVETTPVRRDYLAVVSAMDAGIGRVLDALDRLELADDTIVVFLSDNGPLPRHKASGPFVGGKDTLDEGGIRVPAIVRWPGNWVSGGVVPWPTTAMDITATLLDATGSGRPVGRAFDGLGLGEVFTVGKPTAERPIFWDHPSRRVDASGQPIHEQVVRLGRWRLTRSRDGDVALHDTDADPAQVHDVAAQHPELVAELLAKLDAYLADVAEER